MICQYALRIDHDARQSDDEWALRVVKGPEENAHVPVR